MSKDLNKKEYALFKKESCFSKEDLIKWFDSFLEEQELDLDAGYSQEQVKIVDGLITMFKHELQSCEIPILTDDWWHYEIKFDCDSIGVDMVKCHEFKVQDGEMIERMDHIVCSIFSVDCDYLTVEEFAKLHDVKPITVNQWIRRGKIRGVKKVGLKWSIPEIASRPTRGFIDVDYRWDADKIPKNVQKDFPFIGGTYVAIWQRANNKSEFLCVSEGTETLNAKDRERLETMLMADANVETDEWSGALQFREKQL